MRTEAIQVRSLSYQTKSGKPLGHVITVATVIECVLLREVKLISHIENSDVKDLNIRCVRFFHDPFTSLVCLRKKVRLKWPMQHVVVGGCSKK
jgi:hypothetical protein